MENRSTSVLTLQYWQNALNFSNIKQLANSNDSIKFIDTTALNSGKFDQKVVENIKFKNFFKDKTKGVVKFILADGSIAYYADTWLIFGYKISQNDLDAILAVPIYINEQGHIIPNLDSKPFLNSNYLEPVDEIYATCPKIGTLNLYEKYQKNRPLPSSYISYDNEIEKKFFSKGELDYKRFPQCEWEQWWEYSYTMFLETYNSPDVDHDKKILLTQFLRSQSKDGESWYSLASQFIGQNMTASIRDAFIYVEKKVLHKIENFKNEFPLVYHICHDNFTQNILKNELIESNTLLHTGHMDSYDDISQKRSNFPLDPSQRESLLHFLSTPNGYPLAISGPPGTGKTSMLKGVIATLWVNKTIESNYPQSPIIIATSSTNNATKNIIASFFEIPGRSEEHILLKRWISGIFSYGWFFPSEGKKQESQQFNQLIFSENKQNPKLNFQGDGAANELNISKTDFANREKRNYLKIVNEFFGQNFSLMEDCISHLHKNLKTQCENILPTFYKNYKDAIHIVTSYDMTELEKSLERVDTIKAKINIEKNKKEEREDNYKEKIHVLEKKKNFLYDWVIKYTKFFEIIKRSKYYNNIFLKYIILLFVYIIKSFYFMVIKRNIILHKFIKDEKIEIIVSPKLNGIFKNFDSFINSLNLKIREYENNVEILNLSILKNDEEYNQYLEEKNEKIKKEYDKYKILKDYENSIQYIINQSKIYLLSNNYPSQIQIIEEKFQNLYKMNDLNEKINAVYTDKIFESFQALLDCTIRTYNFHMTARYWEGRWLCDVFPEQKKTQNNFKSLLIENLRTFCMIAPCIVTTFHMMPKLFYDKKNGMRYSNEADLLIVDEAGQCCLETSIIAFSFAKKALIVGDVKQLEPVYNLDKEAEHSIAKTMKLTEQDKEKFIEREILASKNNLMSLLQTKSYFTKPYSNGLILTRHYRCVPNIIEFCNELVYDGDLIPVTKNKDTLFPSMGYACHYFQATQYKGSWQNEKECFEIIDWLKENEQKIINKYNPDGIIRKQFYELVAIITPYKSQEFVIKEFMEKEWFSKIKDPLQYKLYKENFIIGTVHSLQGAERPIVIYSMVNHKEEGKTVFWDKKTNLLNVAISRAKDCFLVFCHKELLFSEKVLAEKSSKPSVKLGQYLFKNGKQIYPTIAFIVESPNKIETLQKILPREYKVFATGGFFRELDLESHDTMEKSITYPIWKLREDRKYFIDEIRKFVANFGEVILATDNDREGELISWHLKEYLQKELSQNQINYKRIRFDSIDEKSILNSIKNAENKLNKKLIQSALLRHVYDMIYSQFIKYKAKKIIGDNKDHPFLSRNHLSIFKLLQQQKEKSLRSGYTLRVKFTNQLRKKSLFGKIVISNSLLAQQRVFQTSQEAQEYADSISISNWNLSTLYALTKTIHPKTGMTTAETIKRVSRMHGISPEKTMEILQSLYDGSAMIQSSTHNPKSHRFNFGGKY
ncbi:hypothetical protein GCL60_11960 [Silvanigrella paludirubra]|uniref:Toprim domain-containing protein n=1 Tax=Silvanigrella paludirubra TaxID=2499159 RepID=A0A6N6VRA3_9BACT|nr:AAA domain-containing protein [Silvanigrella paludirubra]KAB8037882.1 hypothetical protein GCL60_11960 [Silvanigrella paludirubra]